MAHHILEFRLEIDLKGFLDTFWYSDDFYLNYLEETLLDKEITIGEWSVPSSGDDMSSKVRHVQSQHPCKVSFPGLPSHAESTKVQKLNFDRESEGELTILESNSFKGIPMADYFRVDTMWTVRQLAGQNSVDIIITGEVVFLYSTWLKGSIESNTYAELDDVFASWKEVATLHLQSTALPGMLQQEPYSEGSTVEDTAIVKMPPLFPSTSAGSTGSTSGDDNDLDGFYDCEEGRDMEDAIRNSVESSPLLKYRDLLYRSNRRGDHLLAPQELMDMYDQVERGGHRSRHSSGSLDDNSDGLGSNDDFGGEQSGLLSGSDSSGSGSRKPMRRYIAITVVEIVFVLGESAFWQIQRMYKHDVKELFQIEPIDVVKRVAFSFIPGKHTPLLATPDLYGPVVATCILPQVMLVAMDSTHHGCSRTSLLGDAVVVSLCLWFGLAGIYRVFGILVAPMLSAKHCLCLTGYSLFPWIFALFLSYMLDTYPNEYISPQTPLYILGWPAAIAQGYVFWEYTPLAFYHNHLDHLLPLSLRDLTQRHRRVADNVLWYFPKALVLIVIAVTHYQFLWYVAHTFLPGRKHMCRISALINPSNYADILSQKELRSFAVDVAKKVG